jgi:hypothetical protein
MRLDRAAVGRVVLSGFIVVALAGSAAVKPKPTVPVYEPRFQYSPKADASDNVATTAVVAVISPVWGRSGIGSDQDPNMKKFKTAMTSGIAELLTAKKLVVKGPYNDVGDMTYSEKKGASIAVIPELEIDLVCKAQGVGFALTDDKTGQTSNSYKVQAGTTGTVILKIVEPQSKEVLAQKRIELESLTKEYETGRINYSPCGGSFASLPVEGQNAVLQAIEQQFGIIMGKFDGQLSRGEIAELQKQSNEIKSKKVY